MLANSRLNSETWEKKWPVIRTGISSKARCTELNKSREAMTTSWPTRERMPRVVSLLSQSVVICYVP